MADQDNIIRATTSVDTSGLKSGMSEASGVVSAGLNDLRAKYDSAAAQVTAISKQMADAQKAGWNPAYVQVFQKSLDEAKASMASAGVAIAELSSGLETEAAAAEAAATATTTFTTSTTQARYSAMLLGREMGVSIPRALSSIAAQAPIVGAVMQNLFPYIAAVAFGQILANIIEEVEEYFDGTKRIKELNETIGKELEEQNRKRIEYQKNTKALNVELLAVTNPGAAQTAKAGILTEQLKLDRAGLKDLEAELISIRKRIETAHTSQAADQSAYTPSRGRGALGPGGTGPDEGAKALDVLVNQALPETTGKLAVLRDKIAEEEAGIALDKAKAGKDYETAAREAAAKAKAAFRQREQDARSADEEALSDLKANHQVTVAEEIEFWTVRLAAEQQFSDRVREIKRSLGTLAQEADKEATRAEEKELQIRVTAERAGLAQSKRIDEEIKKSVDEQAQKWEEAQKRTLQATITYWSEIAKTYSQSANVVKEALDKAHAAQLKLNEETAKAPGIKEKGASEGTLGGLEGQREAVQRAESLDLDTSNQAKIRHLEQLKAIDQQIINEKIRSAKAEEAIALAESGGDTNDSKYLEAINKRVQVEQAGAQKIYADETAILHQRAQLYQNFFNQIQTGFTHAVDAMITSNQRFSTGLVQMWQGMVVNFDNALIKMLLHFIEKQVLMTIAHGVGQDVQVVQTLLASEKKNAIEGVDLIKSISKFAVKAAAGAYSAIVPIPIVGPILAPIAAGVAFAAVEGLAALAAFEGGGIVPNTGVAMVHGGEAVLPAHLTSMLMNVANGGNSFTNNGGIHVHGGGGANGRQQGRDILSEISAHMRRNNMQMA